jgi:hypothetical protein
VKGNNIYLADCKLFAQDEQLRECGGEMTISVGYKAKVLEGMSEAT